MAITRNFRGGLAAIGARYVFETDAATIGTRYAFEPDAQALALCERLGVDPGLPETEMWAAIGRALALTQPEYRQKRKRGRPKGSFMRISDKDRATLDDLSRLAERAGVPTRVMIGKWATFLAKENHQHGGAKAIRQKWMRYYHRRNADRILRALLRHSGESSRHKKIE